jgi:hypothetical protein
MGPRDVLLANPRNNAMIDSNYQRQYTVDEWGRQQTVPCEEEWLLEPEVWYCHGLTDEASVRKQRLFWAHHLRTFLDNWPGTEEIKDCLIEDDVIPRFGTGENIDHLRVKIEAALSETLSDHLNRQLRIMSLYARGVVTSLEALNKTFETICDYERIEARQPGIPFMQRSNRAIRRALAKELTYNPFRPIALDPRWLTSTVVDLVTAIYNEKAFDRSS